MRIVRLEIDNRWQSEDSNEITIVLRDMDNNDTTIRIPYVSGIADRIYDTIFPELTNHISGLFEQLTGSDAIDTPIISDAGPFLKTNEEASDES